MVAGTVRVCGYATGLQVYHRFAGIPQICSHTTDLRRGLVITVRGLGLGSESQIHVSATATVTEMTLLLLLILLL